MRGWAVADRAGAVRPVALLLLGLTCAAPSLGAQEGPARPHAPTRYDITIVTSDTGAHLLGEVEAGWRLESVNPVEMQLDSTMDVVRVLVDGQPNTRLSRTMYSRDSALVVVPHEKAPGDTLTTRVRYHGYPAGGFRAGADLAGARAFAGTTGGGVARLWLPVPTGDLGRAVVTWNVQASKGQRVVANGVLTGIDTLNYGHSTWHYRTDVPIPLDALAVAADHYAVTTLPHPGCARACVPVTLWTAPADSAAAAAGAFRRAGEMVDWLSSLIGPFPYRGLAHVASLVGSGGRAGASVVLYDEQRVHAGRIEELEVARATAAQWFGDAVSESGLAPERPSDAVASYLALLWTRHAAGGGAVPTLTATRQVTAIQRLHQELGDSAFFRGLRRYLAANRNATAAPGDFARMMSEGADRRRGGRKGE
jgi:aminopeptidase N